MKSNPLVFHPATGYLLLTVVVVFLSWVCSIYGLSAVHPQTGETIAVLNLLSPEGIRWFLRNVVSNVATFVPLGTVGVSLFGLGLAKHSGLLDACFKLLRLHSPNKRMVIFVTILLGFLSNLGGDIGYIFLLPISAALFQSARLHPVAGIITAYVAVACGYSTNVVIGTTDFFLSLTTQEAATHTAEHYIVGTLSNFFFTFASTLLLGSVVYIITSKHLLPRLGKYTDPGYFDLSKPLTHRDKKALKSALIAGVIFLTALTFALLASKGLLQNINGSLIYSPFTQGILFLFAMLLCIMAAAYGITSGKYRNDKEVIAGLSSPFRYFGVYFVMIFFAAQMFACISYTKLDQYLPIHSAELFSTLQISPTWLLFGFILFTAIINLLIPSTPAKWSVMAFIFVPLFASLGIAPEIVQCAFRIGDSSTSAITPLLLYAPLALTYISHYEEEISFFSLFRHTWRYSLSILLIWSVFFMLWYLSGLPLGI